MNSQSTDQGTSSGPKDRSLNAFKAWILEIAKRLTTEQSGIKLTEAEWTKYWKEFWSGKLKS